MPKVFTLLLALSFLFQPGPTSGGEVVSRILEGMGRRYADLPGLEIPYSREVITRSMSMLGDQVKGDVATGIIYFKPPSFLRLEQKNPEPEIIVTDGTTLWWYIPTKKEVHEYSYAKFGQELNLLSDLLRGLGNGEERFQIRLAARDSQGSSRIELRPDPPWEEIERIVLTLNSDFSIREVTIHNILGTKTRFSLKDMNIKENFEAGFFQFAPPKGVRVIREQG